MTQDSDSIITGELCPACGQKTLTLMEKDMEIPYFGKAFIFSMSCENPSCSYHLSDVELEQSGNPLKAEFEVSSEADLSVRVIKSSSATVKIPRVMTIEPGPASSGYITNVEGILNRVKRMLESTKESSDDKSEVKKCKTLIKKIQDVLWGHESLKITIEDPNGNSAIVSEKTVVTKGKKK